MYENGYGVPADKTLAVRWYRLAAMLGYDLAAEDLKRLAR
jgi:TPR repeat protein